MLEAIWRRLKSSGVNVTPSTICMGSGARRSFMGGILAFFIFDRRDLIELAAFV
jgi:hypothetical protein